MNHEQRTPGCDTHSAHTGNVIWLILKLNDRSISLGVGTTHTCSQSPERFGANYNQPYGCPHHTVLLHTVTVPGIFQHPLFVRPLPQPQLFVVITSGQVSGRRRQSNCQDAVTTFLISATYYIMNN